MTLGFKTHINGVQTHFMEKIWASIPKMEITDGLAQAVFNYGFNVNRAINCHPKIHTIREDEKDRWKVGMKIHAVINNRTKDRLQFAPTLEVKGIQEIEIEHEDDWLGVHIDHQRYFFERNSKLQTQVAAMEKLARNDGFDSLEDFFDYFDQPFKGKIIHWTDFKY